VRSDYSDVLKSENYIGPLFNFMFDVLGHSDAHALNLDKSRFDASMIKKYDIWDANDSESNERNMQWLLINLYYQCLKYTPSLAKTWWVDCKSKQTRIAVESWTEKYFSPLVIADTLDEVSKWADEQESSEDEKELIVKVSKRSREVFAGYEIDDMAMQIVVRLPATYPLEGVKVDGVNRVAVDEKKWTNWLMITQGVITFSVRSPITAQFFPSFPYLSSSFLHPSFHSAPSTDSETEWKHNRRPLNLPPQRNRCPKRPNRMCDLLLHHLFRPQDAR
jgi:hypothetical protein